MIFAGSVAGRRHLFVVLVVLVVALVVLDSSISPILLANFLGNFEPS